MSFGRWLLVHSFSLFMLALLILLYLFRNELQLDKAYHQLLSMPPLEKMAKKSAADNPSKTQPLNKQKVTGESKPANNKLTIEHSTVKDSAVKQAKPENLVAVPTLRENRSQIKKQPGDLIRARKAYWDNDYARAIEEYKRLISQHPENPDYLGELGNIYYTLYDDQHAARLYYQAAELFIRQNKLQRARSLIAPITAMDRELGERLQQQIKH